jgi:hypothetical protein
VSLTDQSFWVDVLERAGRQAVQVVIPVLLLAATTGHLATSDVLLATAASAAVAFLVVVFRALTGLRADDGASLTTQAVDRAIAAFAGSVAAVLTANGFDLLHADFRGILLAASSSALLALVAMVTNTPASAA